MTLTLERVAVALDTSDRRLFEQWARRFGPRVGMLKVGLEAFSCFGPEAIEEARRWNARVFLDLKLHDIPRTVASTVAVLRDRGASYLTVHAAGGETMLAASVEAARGALGILAVTVLTHIDAATLRALDLPGDARTRVLRWAKLAESSGCAGAVCSPLELRQIRENVDRTFQLVTPGIRHGAASHDDQRRVASAGEALRDGADWLVIGRPLTSAPDPERALAELASEIAGSATA